MKTEHYPVFDCAIGDRAIHYMGHVKMMGAVQPFISGAISKTVNLPEEATVDEVVAAPDRVVAARRQGDRDLPRQLQGRAAALRQKDKTRGATTLAPVSRVVGACRSGGALPEDRIEVGRKFKVGEYEGYIHVGLFEDGTPGDIFVDIAKEGTTLAGLMNSFMISVSLGLQYGVPLEVYVSKFSHMRFEPSGMTNDADIRVAKSIVDYIFRWMGKKFLSADQQEEAGILTRRGEGAARAAYATPARRRRRRRSRPPPPGQTALFNTWEDAVECAKCGGRMVRTGSLLHLPRLRHEHRLLASRVRTDRSRRAAATRLRFHRRLVDDEAQRGTSGRHRRTRNDLRRTRPESGASSTRAVTRFCETRSMAEAEDTPGERAQLSRLRGEARDAPPAATQGHDRS